MADFTQPFEVQYAARPAAAYGLLATSSYCQCTVCRFETRWKDTALDLFFCSEGCLDVHLNNISQALDWHAPGNRAAARSRRWSPETP
jgi:endogenous inhibitor of DNA gyrase (YacG/DUF329 family)